MEKKYKGGMKKIFRQMIHCGLNLFFPKICVACRREGNYLCPRCQQQILPSPSLEVHEGIKIHSLFRYEKNDPLAKLIHHWKYEFVTDLEDLIETLVRIDFDASFFTNSIFCPVPLHKNRFRWRGFNQSERLAHILSKIAGERFGIPLPIIPLITKIRDTVPQGELNREARLKNLEGAFRVASTEHLKCSIILIDDITTTGSTLRECAATLRKHFPASEIRAFVLARTMI